jgi:hypothetical protein
MKPRTDAIDTPETQRRLTEPLGGMVWRILFLVMVVLVVGLIASALGRSTSIWGYGHGSLCAPVTQTGLNVAYHNNVVAGARPGAYSGTADSLEMCASHPTLGQRTLVTLTQAPANILYLAVLVQLWLLVVAARRNGPFALGVSRRLRVLAWFILGGAVVTAVGQSLARTFFTRTLVSGSVPPWSDAISSVLSNLFPLLLLVCGLLTLARIIRAGARMYDDLAGTV